MRIIVLFFLSVLFLSVSEKDRNKKKVAKQIKAIFDIEHWQATGDDDGWQTWANVAFAFDDFSTGSMYAGLAGTDGDILDDEFGLVLGYQKRSDQGTDYNFSATSYDGYVVYGIDVIAQNGLSLSINDYANAMTVMQIGYSFSY